ncbi:phage integrase N-terminal SAM-like domain-containing protein [Candidatus Thiodiazotropha sp. CDECU1]|uniref:phage integrase N-terminal SAM-like domain-containing protein n=1 Tax=Candidatus Thiodiazotropha sp. CDECU1 TaxID=3065865 RepID=UPI0029312A38|nr:phage integrase N-terminal SAM-like domain-containing protein [Candidatus Thiodiazotropha sp. CDECU1]
MNFGGKSWGNTTEQRQPRLLERVRTACRQKHFSPKTEKAYFYWFRQFILFYAKRCVSDSTQSGALNAIAFLYRLVLKGGITGSG